MKIRDIVQFLFVRAVEGVVAIILILVMPNVPPDAQFSKSYSVTPAMPLEGKLTLNTRLDNAEIWHKEEVSGPEAFAEYNGELYTTLHGGDVVKLSANGHITPVVKFGKPCKGIYQEKICGRPLGLNFDKNGALYVADAYYGLFKVDIKTGKKLQLVSVDQEIDGKKSKLPNSVAVASNGDLYWTDSSTEFELQDGMFDMLADGSGRLIHYDAKTKKNKVLLDGLHFANGVALSKDESFVIVSETARSRIQRHYIKGPKKGTTDVFIDGLPGVPDNIQSDGKGGFFIPLVVAKDYLHPSPFQIFGPFPLARKLFARLMGLGQLGFKILDQIYPNEYAERGIHLVGHFSVVRFVVPARVTVIHISESGKILDSLHSLDQGISLISDAFVFKDHLYLGSPINDYIARVPLKKAGLEHLASTKQLPKPEQTTTQAPTTQRPTTTQPPTTASPTTQPPTTASPTTQPPTTTTQPPKTTRAPTTQPPTTTRTPTTQPPTTTRTPTTQPPTTTRAPTTQPPTTKAPSTQPPTTKAPPTTPPTQIPTTKPHVPKQSETASQKPTATPKKQPTTASPTTTPTKERVNDPKSENRAEPTQQAKQPKDSSNK